MANTEHLERLKDGVKNWNAWRQQNPEIQPNLWRADLHQMELEGADLRWANLNLSDLRSAKLHKADIAGATLIEANLSGAQLASANLSEANLTNANLTWSQLTGADLTDANLIDANLTNANLTGACFRGVYMWRTMLGDNDLSAVRDLEVIQHVGPSSLGIDTLFRSHGKIPDIFLRGIGVPEDLITFIPSLLGRPIEFHSSFISYSHEDEEFSRRLHSRMQSDGLRVWFAPEDLKGGRKLQEQIFQAIQIHDKLLLVLSEHSMKSEWVTTEIRRARKVEREENRRKLFPIRLVSFDAIQKWECFDTDSGKDLATDLREYYIPDFSNWKDRDLFEKEFARLLQDLRETQS